MSQVPATPPMQPGPLGPGVAPGWPSVVGIICIIVAGLSILGGLWGMLVPLLVGSLMAAAAQTPAGAAAMQWQWWGQVSGGLLLLLALVLLAGGIGLVRRCRIGPRLLVTWSILRLSLALVGAVIMAQMMVRQVHAMPQGRGAPPPGFMAASMLVGVAFGTIWSAALPIFLLIWLGLPGPRRLIREWP